MTDSHLNSVHLPAPRRALFREARQNLVEGCGNSTRCLSTPGGWRADEAHHRTNGDTPASTLCRWVLVDRNGAYPLRFGVNTVGRFADNEVVLPDPLVSRRHCAILVHSNESCEVHDTASKNGTCVNGQRIAGPTLLKPGDEIGVCDHRLVLVQADAPDIDGASDTWHGV